jgi:hypothetical protein
MQNENGGGILLVVASREDGYKVEDLAVEVPCALPTAGARFAQTSEARPGEGGYRLVVEAEQTDAGENIVRIETAELNRCAVFVPHSCQGLTGGNMNYGEYRLREGDITCTH